MEILKVKNENIKDLKLTLKQYPKQTILQLENILSNVQDRKAFVFLLDAHETEKDITREILEQLIDCTVDINTEFISQLEDLSKTHKPFDLASIFSTENWKSLVIITVIAGVVASMALNENVAIKVLDIVNNLENPSKG
jgi:hypothetical protein